MKARRNELHKYSVIFRILSDLFQSAVPVKNNCPSQHLPNISMARIRSSYSQGICYEPIDRANDLFIETDRHFGLMLHKVYILIHIDRNCDRNNCVNKQLYIYINKLLPSAQMIQLLNCIHSILTIAIAQTSSYKFTLHVDSIL